MALRSLLAMVLLGCASSAPIAVSEQDLSTIYGILATTSSASIPSTEFRVSGISVFDREVTVTLAATVQGDGWVQSARTACRRSGDRAAWRCSPSRIETLVGVPGGSPALVRGLSRESAARAIRFLHRKSESSSSPIALSGLKLNSINCLVSRGDGRIYVQLAGTPHHAGYSPSFIVLEDRDGEFGIESVVPPPTWFEPHALPLPECSVRF